MKFISPLVLVLLALALVAIDAPAHEGAKHGQRHAEGSYKIVQTAFGVAGNKKKVSRTVFLSMGDDMRFSPASIDVREGETIRIVFRNKGKLRHEWVLGTDEELKTHAEVMRKHPDMDHDEVHMVHVDPGKSDELVWLFNRQGSFRFACLLPGHYEAGMVGVLNVKPKSAG